MFGIHIRALGLYAGGFCFIGFEGDFSVCVCVCACVCVCLCIYTYMGVYCVAVSSLMLGLAG